MRRFLIGFAALCGIPLAASEFVEPSSATGDFYTMYNLGDSIDIQWKSGWNWGKGSQPDFADLFIMWFDNPAGFSQLIEANVSLKTAGDYKWTVDVPTDKLASSPKWVFRFSLHTDPPIFNPDNPKMPSRGIILTANSASNASSSTSSTTKSTSSTLTSASTLLTSLKSSPSSSSSSSSSSTSSSESNSSSATSGAAVNEKGTTNTSAIFGGVLGGLAGLAIIGGTVLILLRRARKRREAVNGRGPVELMGKTDVKGAAIEVYAHVAATELPTAPPELVGEKNMHSAELQGSTPGEWH